MAGHSRPKDGVASARLCPGHPRLHSYPRRKTWMPGTRPGMTTVAIRALNCIGCTDAYAARASGASGGASTCQLGANCSFGSVTACSFSSVMPGTISGTKSLRGHIDHRKVGVDALDAAG